VEEKTRVKRKLEKSVLIKKIKKGGKYVSYTSEDKVFALSHGRISVSVGDNL